MDQHHDIALIGGGLSNTSTLFELVGECERNRHVLQLHPRIRVFDIRKEFFLGGEAYAGSAPEMLFTNTFDTGEIREKIGNEELLHRLADWLHARQPVWEGRLRDLHNDKVNLWLAENADALMTQNFRHLHLPRVVLSWFIEDLLYDTVQRANKLGIPVEFVQAEVTDINRQVDGEGFHLALAGKPTRMAMNRDKAGHVTFSASGPLTPAVLDVESVVLATGLPPRQSYPHLESAPCFYNSQTTEPQGDDAPYDAIRNAVSRLADEKGRPVRIGCIGAGPSFLDVAMLLDHDDLRGKFELVSYSSKGRMRYSPAELLDTTEYQPQHLGRFVQGRFVQAFFAEEEAFFRALDAEVDAACAAGYGAQDVEVIVRQYIEQAKHSDSYNPTIKERSRVKLRNHLKQTDPNTARTVARLAANGQLRTIASRLSLEDIAASDTQEFHVTSTGGHHEVFDMLINNGPRDHLYDVPLLRNAMEKGLIHICHHDGRNYLELDAQNRGSENLYLGGALVVDHVRGDDWVHGDVGVGAIMRHSKRIARGIVQDITYERSHIHVGNKPVLLHRS